MEEPDSRQRPAPPASVLGRSPVLAALGPQALASLARAMRPVILQPGQMLFVQGEPGDSVFVVETGCLRLFRTSPNGRERTLAYLRAGEIVGEMAALGRLPRSASAQAAEASRVWRLDGKALAQVVASDGRAALELVELLARRLAEADRQLEEASGTVAEQLRSVLQRLAGQAGDGRLRITQQQLAEMLGVTRESVNRGLSRLQTMGIVRRRGRGSLWVDLEALRAGQ